MNSDNRIVRAGLICMIIGTLVGATVAGAATVTSVTTGNWSNAGTWSAVPQSGDTVVILSGHAVTQDVTSVWLASFTNLGTLVFTGTNNALQSTNVTFSGGTVTHPIQTDTNGADGWAVDHRVWIVCSNLTVGASASINVDTMGYTGILASAAAQVGRGPGGGRPADQPGSGGGHGGAGGAARYGSGVIAVGGTTNDDVIAPEIPGSSGGKGANNEGPAAAGGGVIRIQATGQVRVDGTLSANGGNGGGHNGAGAGGSVQITCNTIDGNGTIRANGGNNPGAHLGGGAGGGGRIAVLYDPTAQAGVSLGSLKFSASGGSIPATATSLNNGQPGVPGTLYMPTAQYLQTNNLSLTAGGFEPAMPGLTSLALQGMSLNPNLSVKRTGAVLKLPAGFILSVTNTIDLQKGAGLEIVDGQVACGGSFLLANGCSLVLGSNSPAGPSLLVTGSLVASNSSVTFAFGETNASSLVVGGDMTLTNGAVFTVTSGPTNGAPKANGGLVSIGGDFDISATNGGLAACIVYPYVEGTNGGGVLFQAKNMRVGLGSRIDASGRGYVGITNGSVSSVGRGPGGGGYATSYGCGGGHGGLGGVSLSGGVPGPTNGVESVPLNAGSSGGKGANNEGGSGAGGGIIRLEANRKIVIDGSLLANGANSAGHAGAGAAGSIYLICRTFEGVGAMNAIGGIGGYGAGHFGGGGGGGGRIAIISRTHADWTGAISVTGGTANAVDRYGAEGTVYWGAFQEPGTFFVVH